MRPWLLFLAVCSMGAAPRGRYLTGPGTVTDRETGLMWADAVLPARPFTQAQAACAASTLAGQAGWRLASIKELQSLLDDTDLLPRLDPAFRSFRSSWSSTPGPGPTNHWVFQVGLSDPVVVLSDSSNHEVLCVR